MCVGGGGGGGGHAQNTFSEVRKKQSIDLGRSGHFFRGKGSESVPGEALLLFTCMYMSCCITLCSFAISFIPSGKTHSNAMIDSNRLPILANSFNMLSEIERPILCFNN